MARDVARYNLEMARWWTRTEPNWRGVLNGSKLASHSQPPGHDCGKKPEACELAEGQVADWGEIWSEHPTWYVYATAVDEEGRRERCGGSALSCASVHV